MNLGITSHSVLLSDVAWCMGVYNDMYMHAAVQKLLIPVKKDTGDLLQVATFYLSCCPRN
jgi:hypothetical protein